MPDDEGISIQLETVMGSTNVAAMGYDEDAQVMVVEYKTGAQYRWEGIPAAAYEAVRGAFSVGRALRQLEAQFGKGVRI